MTKPTVLFVHGSWHTPKHFAPICKLFEQAGYPTSCPLQPSIGSLPPVGLKEDVQTYRDELERLVEREGKDVIVISHSYGGVVVTEAVDRRFAKKERASKKENGGVMGLLYMCAFMLEEGQCLSDPLGGASPPFIKVDDDGMATMLDPGTRFYNDMPASEHAQWIEELRPIPPQTTHFAKISQTAWSHHPVTYLFCENDQAIPLPVQKMMVEKVKSKGIEINEHNCTAGHSPYLSMPERVLEVVRTIG